MLEEYRREYVDFSAACMREHYLFFSGQKLELELAPIYDRYSDLFSQDSISRIKQAVSDTPAHFDTERRALGRLLGFATEQFLENRAKRLTEEVSQYEAAAQIEWRGRRMTFQDSTVAVITESDRAARRAIYDRRAALIADSNDLRAERLSNIHLAARALGYESYLDLYGKLRGLDYEGVARAAHTLLERTEPLYLARLDQALKRDLGIGLDQAHRSDALRLLHLTGYDNHFPATGLLRVYRETLAGLGISPDLQTNITVDSELRPRKNSRAFCTPISIPEEIKLVIRPIGGQSDYQAFLHESGHAQHYGWTSPALRPEFKYTGDYALTETYAFLFNHLVTDPDWLSDMLNFQDNLNFIRSAMLARLVTVRRYIAKLMYECDLHAAGQPGRGAALYAELQTAATKFDTPETDYLYDLDDSFYSASYVRAWAFEVALREFLKTRFGQRWWASPRAGSFLKEVWETGDLYTADEMADQIGLGPITFDSLIDEFNRVLK
jgi:hypothetical protein